MKIFFSYFRNVVTIGALSYSCLVYAAQAQDRLPTLQNFQEQQDKEQDLSEAPKAPARMELGNAYIEDTIFLQYQISLLERLIERQSSISKLQRSYGDLGVPFFSPPPPRDICEQIPANIPCHRAYMDLYNVIVPQVNFENIALNPLELKANTSPQQPAEPVKKISQPDPSEEEEILVTEAYLWTDILCGGGVCTATLFNLDNRDMRYTVQQGDFLEGKTIEIIDISANGVRARENGKTVALLPALSPTKGGPTSLYRTERDGVDLSTQPQSFLDEGLSRGSSPYGPPATAISGPVRSQSQQQSQQQSLPQSIPQPTQAVPSDLPIDDPGPPLGPTGLF